MLLKINAYRLQNRSVEYFQWKIILSNQSYNSEKITKNCKCRILEIETSRGRQEEEKYPHNAAYLLFAAFGEIVLKAQRATRGVFWILSNFCDEDFFVKLKSMMKSIDEVKSIIDV